MGKGVNASHTSDGLYTVDYEYDTAAITALIAKLTATLAELNSEQGDITSDISSTESSISSLETTVKQNIDDLNDLKAELGVLNSDLDTANDRLDEIPDEIAVQEALLVPIDARMLVIAIFLSPIQASIASKQGLLATKQGELSTLQGELVTLQDELAAATDPAEIARIEAEISIKETEISDKEDEISTLEDEISDLQDQEAPLVSEYDDLAEEKLPITTEISDLESEQTELEGTVSTLEGNITSKESEIDTLTDTKESNEDNLKDYRKDLLDFETALALNKLKIASTQKALDEANTIPTSLTGQFVWCADLTEDLSGEVGLMEVAGFEDSGVNIQPGWVDPDSGAASPAVYDAARDGITTPVAATTSAQAYFNKAMQGGWQKWDPTYRWGTITAVDYDADTCSLEMSVATNPDTGLDVNKMATLSNVPIKYMSCNSAPFAVDDTVVVKFTGQSWDDPVVIGFTNDPKGCFGYMVIQVGSYSTVWDLGKSEIAEDVPTNADPEIMAVFPILTSEISTWISGREPVTFDTLFQKDNIAGIVTPAADWTSGYVYNNSYECTGPLAGGEWYEDYSYFDQYIVNFNDSSIFGPRSIIYDDYHWSDVLGEFCPGAEGDMYWNGGVTRTWAKLDNSGFTLTALNGSESVLNFYQTNSLTEAYDSYGETDWNACTGLTMTRTVTQNLTPTYQYFSPSPASDVLVESASACGDSYIRFYPPAAIVTVGAAPSYAAHYSEDHKAVVQLFIYKDESNAYHGYGQADINLEDYTVSPTSLSENSDLSAALVALADAADSKYVSAAYYK